ncbi:MAG TPA: hypothetical protein DEA90_07775 [Opitutae bacterium]|nr:hypothetical protein [Puniceicoccaceae bacterium]HBR94048.1 hypothetical protein [Opitutae bacterium]|tara:strand:+ start:237 stop:929 length:693 start_codon:yes stop_codon:yes gene_type:complete
MLKISHNIPFGSGGNRICYRHPHHADRCLKVLRQDRTPELRRKEKKFPSNLRPLKYFDENLVELEVLNHLNTNYPEAIRRHIPQSFGMIETDLGLAHSTSLISDSDGLISQTLEQYIWKHGLDAAAERSIENFKDDWSIQPPPTRDLIPHNLVIKNLGDEMRLILIDGLGRKPRSANRWTAFTSRKRYQRRMKDFDQRIQLILHRKTTNTGPTERLNNLKRNLAETIPEA